MSRKLIFWSALAIALAVALFLLREVLLPFLAALVIAYLLNPVVNRLEKLGLSRTLAALVLLLLFFVLLFILVIVLVPLLANQLIALIGALPGYVVNLHGFLQARLAEFPDNPVTQYLSGRMGVARDDVGTWFQQGAQYVGRVVASILSGGQAIVSVMILVLLTPILAFYLLADWPRMVSILDSLVPVPHREAIRGLGRDVDRAMAGYIRGQATLCVVLAIAYGAALTAVGLNFGLLIGVAAGLLSIIPYVGAMTGLATALAVGVTQFGLAPVPLGLVLLVFIVGNIIEAYVLYPKLVGTSVGLHPVWIMFALVAFGALFGFVGLLVAVPLAAALSVVLRFALARYQESPYYTGAPARETSPGG